MTKWAQGPLRFTIKCNKTSQLTNHSSKDTRTNMKKLLIIIGLIFVIAYWTEVSNFVSGNFSSAGDTAAKWMVDHTPKK